VNTNLERFTADLKRLIGTGNALSFAMKYDCFPEEMRKVFQENLGDKDQEFIKNLPSFATKYQSWYSEALALLRQLLPDRVSDFVRHYEKPKARKTITFEN
jgi:hypothetical protein